MNHVENSRRHKSILNNKKERTGEVLERERQGLTDEQLEQMTLQFGQRIITKFKLEGNQLTMKSMEVLFKFVQRNKNVKVIDVRDNQIEKKNREKL